MKRRTILRKVFGIIALIAVIGFLATACPEDDNGGGPTFLGDKLELSGQVYLAKWNDDYTSLSYQDFSGNLAIDDNYGGSGEIKNGKLSYSIGVPTNLQTLDFTDEYNYDGESYNNFSVSKSNVKGLIIWLSVDSNDYYGVYKGNTAYNVQTSSSSRTIESVNYVYVEEDVTVSGSGKTDTGSDTYDGVSETWKSTTGNLNLAFKKGWNAVYGKTEISQTFTGTLDNPTSINGTYTNTLSLSNPSLRWLLGETYDD